MKLVIVLPAFNEEGSVAEVIKRIPKEIKGIEDIEIVVIDDGSIDQTVAQVRSKTRARVISHGVNRGVGLAFRTGLDYALKNKADILVTIDADGQFNPLDIPKLVQPILNKEADLVTASRFIKKDFVPRMPRLRYWDNQRVAQLISWFLGQRLYDVSCGFRAYSREALLNLNLFGQFTYTQEVFLDLGFKGLILKEIPVRVKYFPNRRSKVFKGGFDYAQNILRIILKTVRDYQPLKFFGSIGLFLFLSGLVFDLIILVIFIQTSAFTPYKWIGFTGVVLNIIGLIILVLALIADMLFRIRMNQEKILYHQKKKIYERDQ